MPRGGKRAGAGRPAGSQNKDTAARRAALSELVDDHVEIAIKALSHIAMHGESEAARVSASTAILDRAYGKPAQAVQMGFHDETPRPVEKIERVIIQAAHNPVAAGSEG